MIKKEKGQLLVELMVAMSVMLIGLLGIMAVLSQSLGLNRVAANQYIAANLAAEGVEVVKNIIDANAINARPWNSGLANGVSSVQFDSAALGTQSSAPLLFNSSNGRYSYASGDPTGFRRTISISNIDTNGDTFPDEIAVVSTVTWTDRGGLDFSVDVEGHFRDWRS
jgi:hypothetical protein